MKLAEIHFSEMSTLPIEKFREMDYLAINKYSLPIELMMENAGLNLARLATSFLPKMEPVLIGIGKGNNGGGGLVAARRLAGWGYSVYLDIPDTNLTQLPALQLERALKFGVKIGRPDLPKLFIDSYFGFSQRLPLPKVFEDSINFANRLLCPKISLDLPSGFNKQSGESLFIPDAILTLAAMKTELIPLLSNTLIFVADLGIPFLAYKNFTIPVPVIFQKTSLVRITA